MVFQESPQGITWTHYTGRKKFSDTSKDHQLTRLRQQPPRNSLLLLILTKLSYSLFATCRIKILFQLIMDDSNSYWSRMTTTKKLMLTRDRMNENDADDSDTDSLSDPQIRKRTPKRSATVSPATKHRFRYNRTTHR